MTIVYRIETINGEGVYRGEISLYIYFDSYKHPMPNDDSLLMQNLGRLDFKYYHFGFASLGQLRSWFYADDWMRKIAKNRNFLSIYDAKEVYLGNAQVCFNRDTANRIEQHEILEFFNIGE